jgi:hypothetical protein
MTCVFARFGKAYQAPSWEAHLSKCELSKNHRKIEAEMQCSAIPQNGPIPPTAAHGAGHVPLVRVVLTAEAYPD